MAPKVTRELSQAKLAFPTKKSSSSAQQSKSKGKTDATAQSTVRAPVPKTREELAEARAKAPGVSKVLKAKAGKKPLNTDGEEDSDYADFDVERSDEEEDDEEPVELVVSEEEALQKPNVHTISSSEEEDEADEPVISGKGKGKTLGLKDLVKEPEFKQHLKAVKEELGGPLTDSTKGESKATTILRRWDFNYDYGPCVGMTRMERWKRAEDLDLKPPQIIRLILETSQVDKLSDAEVEKLEQSVLHGMV